MPDIDPYNEYDVFISHASQDKYIARLLRGYFRSHNIHSWLDVDQFSAAASVDDRDLSQNIEPAIRNSRYFIILLSEHSISKTWVRRECELAKRLRHEGEKLELVGLTLDAAGEAASEVWLEGVRKINLRSAISEVDPLEKLRKEIGADKPTYINKVKPNFLKQIKFSELSEHLEMCLWDQIDLHFVDGGSAFREHIRPVIHKRMTMRPDEPCRCRVILFDAEPIKDDSIFGASKKSIKEELETRLKRSKIQDTEEGQQELIRKAQAVFDELNTLHPQFDYELSLSERLPGGRFIFAGNTGFFWPFLGPVSFDSQIYVFSRVSPFYQKAVQEFSDVYQEARVVSPFDAQAQA